MPIAPSMNWTSITSSRLFGHPGPTAKSLIKMTRFFAGWLGGSIITRAMARLRAGGCFDLVAASHLPGWQGTQKSNLAQKARYANHKIAASRVLRRAKKPPVVAFNGSMCDSDHSQHTLFVTCVDRG